MRFKNTNSILTLFSLAFFILISLSSISTNAQTVELKWLGDDAPNISTGISWGVPFAKGQVKKENNFSLKNVNGNPLDLQSWPLAYWPDGSIKWIGLSTVTNSEKGDTYTLDVLKKEEKPNHSANLTVSENNDLIKINTGILQCEISRKGNKIFNSLKINNREISDGGELVCILQNGPEKEFGTQPTKEKLIGNIEKVTVEQTGPIRSVIKIEGTHVAENTGRKFLPFVVRLYFYAGQQSVKMVHTIIYDGDQNQDFIRGLGVAFDVPLDEEMYNRHVRLSGENDGFWVEPIQPFSGRRQFSKNKEDYKNQLKGKRIPNYDNLSERQQDLVDNWAIWNDFKLRQQTSVGFDIEKRTNGASAWIKAGAGNHSSGLAFVGDVSGGLTVCVRDFWKSYPSALEIRNTRTDKATLNAWLWSPDGPAMDMRHYDTLAWGHDLNASYEDIQPGFSTPMGVARTSEILLFASSDVPPIETLRAISQQANQPALLTVSPTYLHGISVFGKWSLPDRSTPAKRWIENNLDNAFKYYQLEVDQRDWYGFWDYGDIMHSYDPQRHQWKYDVGGFAWDNTELMPNLWLWYAYLRSGKEDIFRMAEAMTRHTGEVDVHHLGRFEGLGSRHNVRHWGDGAKEVRISQAALSRFYYYLTTDERTGDLMRASVEASNNAIGKLDPLRLILEKNKYPTHARMGPDWLALVGNWMTEWERTGDDIYKEKILTGINSFAKMPYGLYSGKGAAMGYDPATHELFQLEKKHIGYSHLSILMGGPEVAFELSPLLENKEWDKLWLQFCQYWGQSKTTIEKEFGQAAKLGDTNRWSARMPAYYAHITGKKEWADLAWNNFLSPNPWEKKPLEFNMQLLEKMETLEPIYEVPGVSTNATAQWCLNAIEILELVGDWLPEDHPLFSEE